MCARTMLNVNHEGCVNTLQFECTEFYAVHGQDTRNGSSPARWHSSVNLFLQYHQNFFKLMFYDVTLRNITAGSPASTRPTTLGSWCAATTW